MLSLLRRKAQSPFIQATVVIIALVFIFWGVGTSRQGGRNAVATVNDEAITIKDYQQAYEQRMSQFREQLGGNIPKGLLETFDIKSQVLNQLIQGILLRQAAEEMGILISNDEVKQAIQEMDVFRRNGFFDLDQYKSILSASRTTPDIFESSMRTDLLSKKVIESLERFAKVVPTETKELFIYENQEIKLEYVSFAADDFKEKIAINDDELPTYYEENKESYTTEVQFKLSYLSFPVEDEVEQLEISSDEIQEYYEKNIKQYTTPEKRSARHILFQAGEEESEEVLSEKRKQAENVLEMVRAGGDFAELAKQYSEGPSAPQGGNLGIFGRGQMIKAFEDAVFSLEEGATSDVVKTRFGFHIIKLEGIIPASVKLLGEVQEQVASSLKRERAENLAFARANKAYEDIILAGSLAKFAETSEMKVVETGFFARKSPPTSGASGKEIAADQTFLNAVFSLKKGELSSLVDVGWAYAIIYAEDIKEPEISPYEEVQEQVRNAFIAEQAEMLAKKTAEDLLAAARDTQEEGNGWEAEVEKIGATLEESDFFSRNVSGAAGSQKLPASVIEKGFRLSAAHPYPEQIEASGKTFYVFKFKEKKEPQQQLFEDKQEELKTRLLDERKSNLLIAWIDNLKAKAEITINEELL